MIGASTNKGGTIGYLDLFAGPGLYKDGTESTPITILRKAIADTRLRSSLVAAFSDKTKRFATQLDAAIRQVSRVDELRHRPTVDTAEVGPATITRFNSARLMPTFFFADPWGYKGLSLALIRSVLKDWGCDCVFFFNYNRVNMGLANDIVRFHMDVLFTKKRADSLRARLPRLEPREREKTVLKELSEALEELGGRYVLPFSFKNVAGTRTTHHLIFVSKSFKGYEIMKDIMAGESSTFIDGVPSFEFCPMRNQTPTLPGLFRPLEELKDQLLRKFAAQRITTHQIFERHTVGTNYVLQNYKRVLTELETDKKIETYPTAEKRRKTKEGITFGNDVVVTFPRRA